MKVQPASARLGEFWCPVCGAKLDDRHVEAKARGLICAFCGSLQAPPDIARALRPEIGRTGVGVGESLREARERSGTSTADAARATCIRERYLLALEEDEPLGPFPGRAYARYFLREYAQHLGLDPAPLLLAYDDVVVEPEPVPEEPPIRRPWLSWRSAVAASLVILLVGVVLSHRGAPSSGLAAGPLPARPPAPQKILPQSEAHRHSPPISREIGVFLRFRAPSTWPRVDWRTWT